MKIRFFLSTLCAALVLLITMHGYCEEVCGPMSPSEEQLLKAQQDLQTLTHRLKEFEARRCISEDQLLQKKVHQLKGIAADVKLQRQTMDDFQRFVSGMDQNLKGLTTYIKAGSYTAVSARTLPIPYAGHASIFTKFSEQFTTALNSASAATNAYLLSSQKFIVMVDTIDPAKPFDRKAIADSSLFADSTLHKDMHDAQIKLAAVSDLSSGTLSFLESINHYMSETDKYRNKTKVAVRKNIDQKEKSFISESTTSMKNKVAAFNARLTTFGERAHKQSTRIKSLALYDELISESIAR